MYEGKEVTIHTTLIQQTYILIFLTLIEKMGETFILRDKTIKQEASATCKIDGIG